MDRTTFKEICRDRRVCWGTMLFEYLTPQTVRLMAQAGYEWLWIDGEHTACSYETVRTVARTAEDVGIVTILRVAQTDYALIARALDAGVSGVMVPRVETAEQVRTIVAAAKYPPIGNRGFGIPDLTVYSRGDMSMAERVEDQNTRRMLFVQVESPTAVENIESILEAGQGQIDTVIFGPADYLMSIGKPDQFDEPELDEAVRKVSRACAARNISNGTPIGTLTSAQWWLERGYNLLTFANDAAFLFNTANEARNALAGIEGQFTAPRA